MSLADQIRTRREATGFSIAKLADRAGVSKAYIQQLETSEGKNPSADVLYFALTELLAGRVPDLKERTRFGK